MVWVIRGRSPCNPYPTPSILLFPHIRCNPSFNIRVSISDGTGTLCEGRSVTETVSSEHPRPITTICKNGLTASISVLYVFLTDKGDEAGVHPYNRILASA
jgi:hypothetical protein